MPLYELLCMARPLAARKELAEVANRAGRTVLESGGIVADVKSYGEHTLAYTIRTASGEKIRQANFLELKFAAAPHVLQAVEKDLRLDERIVRWCLRKKPTMPYVPKIKVPKSPRAFEDE